MIKLQVPTGGTGVSFGGKNYTADKKGIVEVPVEAVNDLVQYHGFKTIVEKLEKPSFVKVKEIIVPDEFDELAIDDKFDGSDELDEIKKPEKPNKKN